MLELLIVVSAAAFGAVGAIIGFVAWAVRHEDARLSLADRASGPVTHGVRRLLGVHVMGVPGPARLEPRGDMLVERIDYPAGPDQPGTPATRR